MARKAFYKKGWVLVTLAILGILFLLSLNRPESTFSVLPLNAVLQGCQVVSRTNGNSIGDYDKAGIWIAINTGGGMTGYMRSTSTSSACFPSDKVLDLPYSSYIYSHYGKYYVCIGPKSRSYALSNDPSIVLSTTPVAGYETREVTNGLCGGANCQENWQCGSWSSCSSNTQTRTCTDANYCGTTNNKPPVEQSCSSGGGNDGGTGGGTGGSGGGGSCTPNWQCGDWNSCSSGIQTRTCTDLNNCNLPKPADYPIQRSCCTADWKAGDWGTCVGGQQTRSCTDQNSCGIGICPVTTVQSCGQQFNICQYFNWAPQLGPLDQCTSGIALIGGGVILLGALN